jgi:hypothetical protein
MLPELKKARSFNILIGVGHVKWKYNDIVICSNMCQYTYSKKVLICI